jgi:membrane associated rhomboid family serine protease
MLPLRDNVPTRSFPVVTLGLIAANVGVWIWELSGGWPEVVLRDAYYPCAVSGPCVGIAAQQHLPWYVR